jgi:mono/diheme cytochrome c family protein
VNALRLLPPACIALASCSSGSPARGWPASMEQQPAVQPYEEARPAPSGSIPMGGIEIVVDRDDVEDLKSPSPLDSAAAGRGAKIYASHCVACHGTQARGDGPVSAKFPQAPNLRHYSICGRTDGYLYGTLTAGGRAMPTMREGLTSPNRWDLVAYIRLLQKEGCIGMPAGVQGDNGAAPTSSAGGAP